MSQLLIQQYLSEIDRLRKFSGLTNEQIIRPAFRRLLDDWATSQKLTFLEEYPYSTSLKTTVYPDGTVLHDIRVPLGYWEAKDTSDDLDEEVSKKFRKGYPQDNIIFENSETAILYQNRFEVTRCSMTDVAALLRLLTLFFAYERPEIAEFRRAVEKFKGDLPAVLSALREKIDVAYSQNTDFRASADSFLAHAKDTINPSVSEADVREMLIQHILTEEIFSHVFDNSDFHRDNNIAGELYALEAKFFTGSVKRDTLKALEPYYATIRSNAALISSHHEKQNFLKVIYENFYRIYNPRAADRLGVVYTPTEIVRFMIEGADWLCHTHFRRTLIDNNVEILDPATGTGTFICELIEHFAWDREKLSHKYANELHANEVAILPYYVANLNIEATYYSATSKYAEFENLCFVDTLDNVTALGIKKGHQHDLFGGLSDENIERVKRQNNRKISVVIGNPPYNANQMNENENNKNRTYPEIDKRIKESYIKLSTAQKTKLYDMYARFFRWASDRLHDDGVLAFITNRSFINSRTFDGFRRTIEKEFNEIYVIDLGGDVRENPRLSGTKHNVFGIQIGVAISFMVKRHKAHGCKIFYTRRPEYDTAKDKLSFLSKTKPSAITFERIAPDARGNWIQLPDRDWSDLIALADKETKRAKSRSRHQAIFRLFSFGLVTNRDDWMYGRSSESIVEKVSYLVERYEADRRSLPRTPDGKLDTSKLDGTIKWTRSVKRSLQANVELDISDAATVPVLYRPFDTRLLLFYPPLIEMLNQTRNIFGNAGIERNPTIVVSDPTSQKPFMVIASDCLVDMHVVGAAAGGAALPRYRIGPSGERLDNITDWALRKFRDTYRDRRPIDESKSEACGEHAVVGALRAREKRHPSISKDDIFYYVYAVLHDPEYRNTYALNLKRTLPHVPFYADFWQWRDWGQVLFELHVDYRSVEPWPIQRRENVSVKAEVGKAAESAVLRADREAGTVFLGPETVLLSVPKAAWDYELAGRSAIEWVLEQFRERKPRDPTVKKKFHEYRFERHKEDAVDLIARVSQVSVRTLAILEEMRHAKR